MMMLWHTDSSINHIRKYNHNHSRQSSFDQSINRSIDRKSNSQIITNNQTTNNQEQGRVAR